MITFATPGESIVPAASVAAAAGGGSGPAVVLVHGVGVGPESFARTAAALAAAGRRVHCVTRPGYGLDGDAQDLDEQVDIVLAALAARGEHDAVWAGVSGGATIGVIAASRRPAMIRVAVLHEPLIGPAGGAVHCFVQRAARHLAACPDGPVARRAAVEFVTRLVGADSWAALGEEGRVAVADRTAVIRAEVPRFAAFEPGTVPDDGAVSVVVTVGERSPDMRHEAAARAAELLHGRMVLIPGVGHLPQVEAPDAFAELIGSAT